MSVCYHKYIYAANQIREILIREGRDCKSDFVLHSVGHHDKDRVVEEIFPLGGHPMVQKEDGKALFRRYFVESYLYSDKTKTGR